MNYQKKKLQYMTNYQFYQKEEDPKVLKLHMYMTMVNTKKTMIIKIKTKQKTQILIPLKKTVRTALATAKL